MSVKISVIVPVYNVENYLRECLDSIVIQQYDNYEVICVNDGSTDNSLDILEEFAAKYEYVKVISKGNGGLSSARNCGIENATGDYLYFLDSDDMLADENVLSDMASYVQKDELDILYLDGKSFYESQALYEKSPWYEKAYTSERDYGLYETGIELFSVFASYNDFRMQACFQCIKKEFVDRYNLRYLNGILYEDNLFFFKSILSAGRVRHVKRVVMKRRVREGSIMQSKVKFSSLKSYLYIYIECKDFLHKLNILQDKYQTELTNYVEGYKDKLRWTFLYELEQIERKKIENFTIIERQTFDEIIKEWKYIFPHHLLKENSNIAIYGAGNVGVEYYYQAVRACRYNNIFVADKKGNEASTEYMEVIKPEELADICIDNIIIAVKSESVAMEIKSYLEFLGIDEDRIVWDIKQPTEKRLIYGKDW